MEKETWKERRRRERKVIQDFANMLFEKYQVQDNPKAQKAFDIAWDYGHSGGYTDVEIMFEELLPLIED
jgi:hypothetical protein